MRAFTSALLLATVHQPLGPQPGRIITSTVLGVTLRVAGDVTTDVHPYAIGTAEQQVTARLGDVESSRRSNWTTVAGPFTE